MHFFRLDCLRAIRLLTCGCLLCVLTLKLSAIEGIDYITGGDWNTETTIKPWSYDGQNLYGTAGYHFYNVTPLGGDPKVNRPVTENLKSALPPYIKAITPAEGAYTSQSHGYLAIDPPGQFEADKVESGILAQKMSNTEARVDLLTIELGAINRIYGFRLGVFIANADRKELTPQEVTLRSKDEHWSRSIINLPASTNGIWVFFTIPSDHAKDSLVISIKPRRKSLATISGLVFDDLIVAPPQQPLNVATDSAVTPSSSVIWDAAKQSETPETAADTWEHTLAMKLSGKYRQNKTRIEAIQNELSMLPVPYTGEPTGTGGYLSHWLGSSKNDVKIRFKWDQPVTIDAVALLPLRLFLADADGLTDNAYWPGKITIHSIQDNKSTLLQTITEQRGKQIQESLPELATFAPCTTTQILITLSNLSHRTSSHQYAGGLSEICIFSEQDNVAPRAKHIASSSREGFRVYSKDYLTDEQTPLGLPEIGPRISGSLGLSSRPSNRTPDRPVNIQLNFDEETTVDSVRLDPAVIYKPGQAFPIRFTVDLLSADGRVLQSDQTYKDAPLRNLGLNPYICHFPETRVKSVRVQVYETSKPTSQSRPWIQISEITPILKGRHISQPATVKAPPQARRSTSTSIFDSTGRRLYWQNDFVYDGQTQAGRSLPLREWIEGLYQRKELLKAKFALEAAQQETLQRIRLQTLWAICLFSAFVVLTALYLIIHSKVKNRRELRLARERIASDLHDDVGSNLGSITLHTEMLMDHITSPELTEHLKAIEQLSHESVYGLREVLHTTAPRIGRAQDILKYMEELSQLVFPDMQVALDLDPSVNTALKTPERRKGLLLYYKEAITNIRSHAQCQHVSVSLHKVNRHLELIIEDDGIGMTPQKLAQQSTLRTLKLRAKEIHADLKIDSTVGQGTRLVLSIPLRS